ncbi:MAG: hypothetical protein A3G31_00425 [Candidatus Schekmanbacteria bacterium RIFCSPLOWO2_12_FULL_38_15]|uniref:Uncharacterized protein n=1 Tax=Candidatus Schekmanbacteria bacterium RIFCSPLOWO2_12_FULL_38_15 TaxID=1817883 RepID=A0A1F7SGF6_9BACT|nr:MAG: hypothetical protein A3G31_00425 [Candidatus Schekmanbacteria bacterium RIFCSPLOWO2_12_FULL_38_15]
MALPENLSSLHRHEEQIRGDSLKHVDNNADLCEHLSMIHGAMAVIYSVAHDHANTTDDELTVQYLGLRLFNSAASSLKLGLSGYYQSAFGLVRDVFETVALLDYMQTHPDKIAIWKASDKNQRITKFGPAAIRRALNERDQFPSTKRKEIYDRLSEYATHATAPGFQLLAPEGLGQIGPFLSERYLKAWIEETVKFLVHGAVIFMAHFSKVEQRLLIEKAEFLEHATRWRKKYMGLVEDQVQPNSGVQPTPNVRGK